jgi:hypothetical protein
LNLENAIDKLDVVKATILLNALILLCVGCKHENWQAQQIENEKRTMSAAEIHQKIPGTWMLDTQYDGGGRYHIITLGSDGMFSAARSNETEQVIGNWRLQEPVDFITNKLGRVVETRSLPDHGSILVVTEARTNYATFENGKTVSFGNVEYYPVMYVDDHELILTPGFSVAGRFRFTR